jgi:metallophosphoesterase superfamily enzyme
MTTLLVVGDVHVKLDNLLEIRCLIEKLERTIEAHRPDFVVLLGDVLHTHERVRHELSEPGRRVVPHDERPGVRRTSSSATTISSRTASF